MAKWRGRKRGLERIKSSVASSLARKKAKKNFYDREKLHDSPSSGSLGDSSDKQSTSGEEEDQEPVVYKEPSMYDNLLRTLGSGSESLANVYKREVEGKSGSEEEEEGDEEEEEGDEDEQDVDGGYASHSTSEEEDGYDNGNHVLLGDMEDEKSKSENEIETSDLDQEHEFTVMGLSTIGASKIKSSFDFHLEHKLTKEEIDNITKKKQRYVWEEPVVGMHNCKWIGTGECFLKDVDRDFHHALQPKLYKHLLDVFQKSGSNGFLSSKQSSFFFLCKSYRDILHCNKKPFYLKGSEEESTVMDAYIIHSLNHVLRTSYLVKKNDAKLGKHPEVADEVLVSGGFLDHGFTRPKVLIMLPLGSIAFRFVKRLIQLTPHKLSKVNVEHWDRFCKMFGVDEEIKDPNPENLKSQKSSKPSDFQVLFQGDNNDSFMIGIKFTRGSIKLYSDFYSSDIIVASPAGLVQKLIEMQRVKGKDVDYLSSIEVLIIDHADVIAMQNWSHVDTIVQRLNHLPVNQHGTNVMRIRPWYLDGQASFYRQTIILGFYSTPDINALFNRHCLNFEGKVKMTCDYKGILPKVLLQVRQIYERFEIDSISNADDARLDYFSNKVFPKIKDSVQGGFMLFVSSYFEFVRLRNFLKSQNAAFCLLGDYTKQSDISRARLSFFEGRQKIMLYTERAHFFHRYKIRGIQNLIIYSLPERKEFYPEIVNMLEGSQNMTCTVLFSRFDQLRLERVVGTAGAKRMVTSENGLFVFC